MAQSLANVEHTIDEDAYESYYDLLSIRGASD